MLLSLRVYETEKVHHTLYIFDECLPEYIVHKEVYDKKLREVYSNLKPGEIINVKMENGLYRAIIKEISCKEEMFKDSTWESVMVEYVDDPQEGNRRSKRINRDSPRLNFWEIEFLTTPCEIIFLSPILDQDDILTCSLMIHRVMETAKAEYFNHRINSREVKTYYGEVMIQKWLTLIHDRIINKYYRSVDSIYSDLNIMLENAIKINGERSRQSRDGQFLIAKIKEIVKRFASSQPPIIQLPLTLPKSRSHLIGYEYP